MRTQRCVAPRVEELDRLCLLSSASSVAYVPPTVLGGVITGSYHAREGQNHTGSYTLSGHGNLVVWNSTTDPNIPSPQDFVIRSRFRVPGPISGAKETPIISAGQMVLSSPHGSLTLSLTGARTQVYFYGAYIDAIYQTYTITRATGAFRGDTEGAETMEMALGISPATPAGVQASQGSAGHGTFRVQFYLVPPPPIV